MFDGIGRFIAALMWLCVLFVPLGTWKAVEIIVWLCKHISFN